MPYVSVVFPVPLHRVFTYLSPEAGETPPAAGARVVAPFGSRRLIGFVVEERTVPPADAAAKRIHRVLDDAPLFTPALWQLAHWMAAYYATPLGMVLRSMLPPGLVRSQRGRKNGGASDPPPPGIGGRLRTGVASLVSELPPDLARRAPARARALAALLERSDKARTALDAASFRAATGTSHAVLKALEREGLVRLEQHPAPAVRPEGAAPRGEAEHPLSDDQRRALEALTERLSAQVEAPPPQPPPRPFLLHGVTGSGKTLVYLKLVAAALARGGQAIVLVPEIGLTPRTASRFEEAFGERVALLHSGLSEGERLHAWHAMHSGEVQVAVGPRSAVFAPFPRLMAIVVDEEHEASYKQEEAPRYNARDVALVRGRLESAVVVLGSATPSLESYTNARADKVDLLELPQRIAGRGLPAVEIVDMRGRDAAERILSRPLREALVEVLGRGEQSLLLLNRRGFSAYLQCVDCGATLYCPNCKITLTLHRARGPTGSAELRCHYCDHRERAPEGCGNCGSVDLVGQGLGTQQVEELLRELLPGARVARMDHDTTKRKGSHRRIVEAMERREIDVLVGTQMVAKGHDFPGLTLVGVVSADTGLNVPDFRAAERTFQLVTQVAGRPGRGSAPGRVLVQTYVPDHPAIRAAAEHAFETFYRAEVEARFEAGYPPAVKLATCLLSGSDETRVEAAAREVAQMVEQLARERELGERLSGVGPSPAPLAQLRGKFRWHYLLKSTSPALLDSALRRLATRWRPPRRVQLILDRDPYNLM